MTLLYGQIITLYQIKILISVDNGLYENELTKKQDYTSWDDYMEKTYQPIFSKYRDVLFKMEEDKLKDLFNKENINELMLLTNDDNTKVLSPSFFLPFMLDRFYFSDYSTYDLTIKVADLFINIIRSTDELTQNEKTEMKRRFVMTSFENDEGKNGDGLSIEDIKEIRKVFNLNDIMDNVKEYFEFVKRLTQLGAKDFPQLKRFKAHRFDNAPRKIDEFDDGERNIFSACHDIFQGYLGNVEGADALPKENLD